MGLKAGGRNELKDRGVRLRWKTINELGGGLKKLGERIQVDW